jgi:hypothetical protein
MQEDRRRFVRDITLPEGLAVSGSLGCTGRPVRCRVVDARSGQPLVTRVRLVVIPRAGKWRRLATRKNSERTRTKETCAFNRAASSMNGGFETDPRMLPLSTRSSRATSMASPEGEIAQKLTDGGFTIGLSRWSESRPPRLV